MVEQKLEFDHQILEELSQRQQKIQQMF